MVFYCFTPTRLGIKKKKKKKQKKVSGELEPLLLEEYKMV